jgi:hypothetical protein
MIKEVVRHIIQSSFGILDTKYLEQAKNQIIDIASGCPSDL